MQDKHQSPILLCVQQGNYKQLPKLPPGPGIQMETLHCIIQIIHIIRYKKRTDKFHSNVEKIHKMKNNAHFQNSNNNLNPSLIKIVLIQFLTIKLILLTIFFTRINVILARWVLFPITQALRNGICRRQSPLKLLNNRDNIFI